MASSIAPLMADVFMNWSVRNVNKIGCSLTYNVFMLMMFSVYLRSLFHDHEQIFEFTPS